MTKNKEHSISNCEYLNMMFDNVRIIDPIEKIIIKKIMKIKI